MEIKLLHDDQSYSFNIDTSILPVFYKNMIDLKLSGDIEIYLLERFNINGKTLNFEETSHIIQDVFNINYLYTNIHTLVNDLLSYLYDNNYEFIKNYILANIVFIIPSDVTNDIFNSLFSIDDNNIISLKLNYLADDDDLLNIIKIYQQTYKVDVLNNIEVLTNLNNFIVKAYQRKSYFTLFNLKSNYKLKAITYNYVKSIINGTDNKEILFTTFIDKLLHNKDLLYNIYNSPIYVNYMNVIFDKYIAVKDSILVNSINEFSIELNYYISNNINLYYSNKLYLIDYILKYCDYLGIGYNYDNIIPNSVPYLFNNFYKNQRIHLIEMKNTRQISDKNYDLIMGVDYPDNYYYNNGNYNKIVDIILKDIKVVDFSEEYLHIVLLQILNVILYNKTSDILKILVFNELFTNLNKNGGFNITILDISNNNSSVILNNYKMYIKTIYDAMISNRGDILNLYNSVDNIVDNVDISNELSQKIDEYKNKYASLYGYVLSDKPTLPNPLE